MSQTVGAANIRFLVNGETVSADNICPTRSLLSYLRENLGLTGTKEGLAVTAGTRKLRARQ